MKKINTPHAYLLAPNTLLLPPLPCLSPPVQDLNTGHFGEYINTYEGSLLSGGNEYSLKLQDYI